MNSPTENKSPSIEKISPSLNDNSAASVESNSPVKKIRQTRVTFEQQGLDKFSQTNEEPRVLPDLIQCIHLNAEEQAKFHADLAADNARHDAQSSNSIHSDETTVRAGHKSKKS